MRRLFMTTVAATMAMMMTSAAMKIRGERLIFSAKFSSHTPAAKNAPASAINAAAMPNLPISLTKSLKMSDVVAPLIFLTATSLLLRSVSSRTYPTRPNKAIKIHITQPDNTVFLIFLSSE